MTRRTCFASVVATGKTWFVLSRTPFSCVIVLLVVDVLAGVAGSPLLILPSLLFVSSTYVCSLFVALPLSLVGTGLVISIAGDDGDNRAYYLLRTGIENVSAKACNSNIPSFARLLK